METTLKKINKYCPCTSGWTTLLENLGKSKADDEPLELMTILKSNGIKDAVWALRCFDYLDYCLFLADVAESVLPIFEAKYTNDLRPRLAIQAVRDYKSGLISIDDLKDYAADAHAAYTDAAADAAAYAAYAAAAADAYSAYAVAAADAAYAAYTAAAAYTHAKKWQELEKLFIKHFG